MNNLIVSTWIGAFLTFVGALCPSFLQHQQVPAPQILRATHKTHKPARIHKVAVKSHQNTVSHRSTTVAVTVERLPAPTPYICRFEGKATRNGHPYANAAIMVWITSSQREEMRQTRTAADGSYSVSFTMNGNPDGSVDWQIRGVSSDFKQVELEGRQILMADQSAVNVNQSLEFAAD